MRAWRAAAAASVAAAALTVAIPGAQAAPLLAATTRVGPTTLPDSLILDQTADGRYVLAGTTTGTSVQRIDRQGNTATAALTLPDLNVGLTDDGAGIISLAVDPGGSITVTRTSPVTGADSFVIAGSLGTGDWSLQGAISVNSDGRATAFSALDATTGRQVVAVASTERAGIGLDRRRRAARRRHAAQRGALDQRRRPVRRLHLVDPGVGLHRRPRLRRALAPRPRRPHQFADLGGHRWRDVGRRGQRAPPQQHRAVRRLRLRRHRPRARPVDAVRPRLPARPPGRPDRPRARAAERRGLRRSRAVAE